tara:strand:+ start:131391 stop:131669 length:279 start_codon:yes stop_codon:yes gene_type:complete
LRELQWSRRALADLQRLYDFLERDSRLAAARTVQSLARAPERLRENPRLGEQLFQFAPREVRRILVGRYEIRYEVQTESIIVLRLWHTRENR